MAGLMAAGINVKSLAIAPEMLDIIGEIDEFKGAWRALGTLAPERLFERNMMELLLFIHPYHQIMEQRAQRPHS